MIAFYEEKIMKYLNREEFDELSDKKYPQPHEYHSFVSFLTTIKESYQFFNPLKPKTKKKDPIK